MQCPRCKGKMFWERFYGHEDGKAVWYEGYRCIMCAEILDETIIRNRKKHQGDVSQQQQTRHDSALQQKDRDLLFAGKVLSFLDYKETIGDMQIFQTISANFHRRVVLYILMATTKLSTIQIAHTCGKGNAASVKKGVSFIANIMRTPSQVKDAIEKIIQEIKEWI